MKILVLQLARLGDIYMTWPVLRAIKRQHPDCQLHFLTRSKFEAAVAGLNCIDEHLTMPTKYLLEPLIQPALDLEVSVERMGSFIEDLQGQSYDWIINFTFSPVSSFLVHAIAGPETKVTGYTRHSDGFLAIPDEVSAYFYAQAGVESSNRVHLTDIFISMLGMEYAEEDWAAPRVDSRDFGLPEKYIVVHVGASEAKKSLPPFKWARVLKNFFDNTLEYTIVMIGSEAERNLGEAIESGVSRGRIVNLIGQAQLRELFHVIQGSSLLVGCDSAPMHIASLTNTPCLNVSFDAVNFWETGPKSTRSFIHRAAFPEDIVSEELGADIFKVLNGEDLPHLVRRSGGLESYQTPEVPEDQFTWSLIKALYLGDNFPIVDSLQFCQAVEKINDVNNLARENIVHIPDKGLETIGPILERADEVMQAVARMVPATAPLVRWYQTEKLRIGPGDIEAVCRQSLEVHEKLQRILSVYLLEDSIKAQESELDE